MPVKRPSTKVKENQCRGKRDPVYKREPDTRHEERKRDLVQK